MQVSMALTSLIVCADAEAVQVLSHILHDLGVEATNCANAAAATERLPESRFDIVVVDCVNEASSTALISSIRNSPLQRNSVIVALVKAGIRASETFETGANLVLYKPLSRERALHSLHTAKGLVRQERRVKLRIPVEVTASIAYAGKEDAAATVIEISETGIGIQTLDNLPRNSKVYFHFTLPGQDAAIRLAGEVMWRAASGRVGVRFVNVPQTSKKVLQRWVEEQTTATPASRSNTESSSKITVRFSTGLGLLSASGPDRRDLSRRPCCIGAEIYRADGSVPYRCTLSDISTGGCYVETTEPFAEGTILTIVVRTLDLKVCVAGRVQSMNRGYGMGVRFNLSTENERQQVEQLLACAEPNSRIRR
jgi:CheY-like chemotaxis protein